MSTTLTFLEDTDQFTGIATVKSFEVPLGEPKAIMVLESTIFYPQGGGQPTDVGSITKHNAEMAVDKVSFRDGVVYHSGSLVNGTFSEGDEVALSIDGARRVRHAKLHTGGHLVMTAVDRLLQLPAVKGYHFPDGPYVEFDGTVEPDDKDYVVGKIQGLLDELVAENGPVSSQLIEIDELRKQGVHVPAEIPAGKPTRVVLTAGYTSPCGGTHVKSLGELAGLTVKGIKNKSGKLRVSYYIEGL